MASALCHWDGRNKINTTLTSFNTLMQKDGVKEPVSECGIGGVNGLRQTCPTGVTKLYNRKSEVKSNTIMITEQAYSIE
jgi:hypothetical protein